MLPNSAEYFYVRQGGVAGVQQITVSKAATQVSHWVEHKSATYVDFNKSLPITVLNSVCLET